MGGPLGVAATRPLSRQDRFDGQPQHRMRPGADPRAGWMRSTIRLCAAGIEVKSSDSRAARYIDEHGTRCWETDMLPAVVIEAERHEEIEQARPLL